MGTGDSVEENKSNRKRHAEPEQLIFFPEFVAWERLYGQKLKKCALDNHKECREQEGIYGRIFVKKWRYPPEDYAKQQRGGTCSRFNDEDSLLRLA